MAIRHDTANVVPHGRRNVKQPKNIATIEANDVGKTERRSESSAAVP